MDVFDSYGFYNPDEFQFLVDVREHCSKGQKYNKINNEVRIHIIGGNFRQWDLFTKAILINLLHKEVEKNFNEEDSFYADQKPKQSPHMWKPIDGVERVQDYRQEAAE